MPRKMRRALPPILLCIPQHPLRTPPPCMLDELDLIPPPTAFPIELESPLSVAPRPVLTPDAKISASGLRSAFPASSSSPDLVATLIAPLTPIDCIAAALLAIAIYLGPDALFAPLGYAPDFRLGLDMECAIGRLGNPSADCRPCSSLELVPGGNVCGIFSGTVILPKSCSRYGGSTILKG